MEYLGGCVKTTVEIPDALLEQARRVASEESITLRELIEDGLRLSLDERKKKRGFRLRRATFRGEASSRASHGIGTVSATWSTKVEAPDRRRHDQLTARRS